MTPMSHRPLRLRRRRLRRLRPPFLMSPVPPLTSRLDPTDEVGFLQLPEEAHLAGLLGIVTGFSRAVRAKHAPDLLPGKPAATEIVGDLAL